VTAPGAATAYGAKFTILTDATHRADRHRRVTLTVETPASAPVAAEPVLEVRYADGRTFR